MYYLYHILENLGKEAARQSGEMSQRRGGNTRTLPAVTDGTEQLQCKVHRGYDGSVSTSSGIRTKKAGIH